MRWFPLFLFLSMSPGVASVETGTASWYDPGFIGHKTSSGEIYNPSKLTAAYGDVPFGTKLLIVCPETNKKVVVRVNDHGGFKKKYGRIIDLSPKAAKILGIKKKGVAQVIVYTQ